MNRPESVSRDAGFTLIEILVVMLVAFILLMLSAPELLKYHIRSQLEGVTQQTSFVLQRARYRAIKFSELVQVCGNMDDRVVTGVGQTVELPESVSLYEINITHEPTDPDNCFIFQADGSVKGSGNFRFSDVRGNLLEVGIESKATARVQVRKYNETEHDWFTRDQGDKAWEWKTGNLL